MTAYAPLGSADRPANRIVDGEPKLFENKTLQALAKNRGFSVAQIMLAWAVNNRTSPIPKSVNKDRLIENLGSADIVLTEHEMVEIASINKNYRYIKGDFWCLQGTDYSIENLWDE